MTTYWRRVRYSGEENDNYPWILKEVENRGFIAIATRSFKSGDWICTEFPMLWVHGHHPFNANQVKEIEDKVNNLSNDDIEAFYDMANVFKEDVVIDTQLTLACGIFMTNSFDMTDSIHGESCGMYLALARLNHSCTPNVQQTHYPDTSEEVLYACRDIEIGDEINDCYIDLRQSKVKRQKLLKEIYRFDCQCNGCNITDNQQLIQDDTIRVRTAEYSDIIISLIENNDVEMALDLINNTIKLLLKPNHYLWSIRYISELYLFAYQIYLSIDNNYNKNSKAYEYLLKAHELNIHLQGKNSSDSKNTLELLCQFK